MKESSVFSLASGRSALAEEEREIVKITGI